MKRTVSAIICTFFLLGGCGQGGESNDYCGNHNLYHADHADHIGTLRIGYTEPGILQAELAIPHGVLRGSGRAAGDGSTIEDTARTLDQMFSIEGSRICQRRQNDIRRDGDRLVAHYTFDCGAGNRLENADIRLLEKLPALDELAVKIDTPAVSKQFLVSRQCDKAIYTIEIPEGKWEIPSKKNLTSPAP